MSNKSHDMFWEIARPWLAREGVSKGTMMGFPCLRVDGQFFASADREGTSLICKLPKHRVERLIEQGEGEPFAPAGRVFKEWVAVPAELAHTWPDRLDEALAFVSGRSRSDT